MSFIEHEWFIQAPWGKLAIMAWGDCYNPPVLLVHGLFDSTVSFRSLVKLLPKNFYYIGMELPGNGKSDPYPPGLMISMNDLVYSIQTVVKHYRWDSFVYLGHSAGCVLGKIYNICYPGKISKLIELDPINFIAIPPEDFTKWYHFYFTEYYKNYKKYNSPKENAPKMTREEAIQAVRKNRPLLNDQHAAAIVERMTEPAGNGLVRNTYDQRLKLITTLPISPEHIKNLITSLRTPILILACQSSLDKKYFRNTAFLLDEREYPNNNMRSRSVVGGHDVHISNPERVAKYVEKFLLFGLDGVDGKTISKL